MLSKLAEIAGHERMLESGAFLFHRDDPVSHMVLVLSGEVRLVRHLSNGKPVILQRAGEGAVLAEASLFSDTYHCDAVAIGESRVRLIDRRTLLDRLASDPEIASRWIQHLSREIRNSRQRSEILSLKAVSDRLDAWLVWHDALPQTGRLKQLANEIGTSPEALYRELARRRVGG